MYYSRLRYVSLLHSRRRCHNNYVHELYLQWHNKHGYTSIMACSSSVTYCQQWDWCHFIFWKSTLTNLSRFDHTATSGETITADKALLLWLVWIKATSLNGIHIYQIWKLWDNIHDTVSTLIIYILRVISSTLTIDFYSVSDITISIGVS